MILYSAILSCRLAFYGSTIDILEGFRGNPAHSFKRVQNFCGDKTAYKHLNIIYVSYLAVSLVWRI
jgi:hypothetical protein